MPIVNYQTREVTCKIVYYGPARSGKTTSIQWVHDHVPAEVRGEIVSIRTQDDRTLFFDFLPLNLGVIAGFTTRLHVYTVPGQVFYESTRRMVLKGADGVIFVADSRRPMIGENLASLTGLDTHLHELGMDIRTIPLVLQYNKQDLPPEQIVPAVELDRALNFRDAPSLATCALRGEGVFQTLNVVTTMALHRLATASGDTRQVSVA